MVVALNTITSNFSLKMYNKFIYDCSSCKFFFVQFVIYASLLQLVFVLQCFTSGVSQCTYANACWCNKKVVIWSVRLCSQ